MNKFSNNKYDLEERTAKFAEERNLLIIKKFKLDN